MDSKSKIVLNWKYVATMTKLTFAACVGEKLFRQFKDIAMACMFEKSGKYKFENSIDDFLKEQKQIFEARADGRRFHPKITRVSSSSFRAEQRRIKKVGEKKKRGEK